MSEIDITVKLFAQYRKGHFVAEKKSYKKPFTVKDVIRDIAIDIETYPVGVLLVNSRHVDEDYLLNNNDTLAIFPKVGGG
jgi:sulfur-carrier protein